MKDHKNQTFQVLLKESQLDQTGAPHRGLAPKSFKFKDVPLDTPRTDERRTTVEKPFSE